MIDRGWRDPEIRGQRLIHQSGHDRNQGIVVNGVGDGVDQFTTDRGLHDRRISRAIAHLAAGIDRIAETFRIEPFQAEPDGPGLSEGEITIRFQPSIPFPMVVVDQPHFPIAKHAGEMIQAMPIMSSNRSIENEGDVFRVRAIRHGGEEGFTLPQEVGRTFEDSLDVGWGKLR